MERKNFKWYIKGGSDSVGGREGTSIPDRWDMNNFSISLSLFSLQELLCWNSQSLTIWWGFKIWTEFSGCNQLLLQGLHHSNASVGSLWQAIVVRAGRSTLEEKPLNGVSCVALHSTGNAGGIRAVVTGEFADPLWPSTRASIHRAGKSADTLALLIPWDSRALGMLGEGHPEGSCSAPPKTLWLLLSSCRALPGAESPTYQCPPFQRAGVQQKYPFGASSRAGFRPWGTSPARSTLCYTNRLWENLNVAFPFMDAKG